jgi:hypothetical protein
MYGFSCFYWALKYFQYNKHKLSKEQARNKNYLNEPKQAALKRVLVGRDRRVITNLKGLSKYPWPSLTLDGADKSRNLEILR